MLAKNKRPDLISAAMKTSSFLGVGLFSLLGWSDLNALTTLNGDHLIAPSGSETGSLEMGGLLSVGGNSLEFGTISGGGSGCDMDA